MSEILSDTSQLPGEYPVIFRSYGDISDLRYFDGRSSVYVDQYYGKDLEGEDLRKYVEATASERADKACAAWAPNKETQDPGAPDYIAFVRGAGAARKIVAKSLESTYDKDAYQYIHLPMLDELSNKIAQRTELELVSWLSDVAGIRMQLGQPKNQQRLFQVNNVLVERDLRPGCGPDAMPIGVNYVFKYRAGNNS